MVQNQDIEVKLVSVDTGDRSIELIREVLESGHLVQGEKVERFEKAVKNLLVAGPAAVGGAGSRGTSGRGVGVRGAGAGRLGTAAVSSGTAALHLVLEALGIGRGDTVLVPAFTFPSTANVVERRGAAVRFVDVDETTFNIDPADLKRRYTGDCRAVIPVHLFGVPADMGPIMEFADAKNLFVIEDAACALGAGYGTHLCGTMGDAGCFSFHPRKLVTTGEGGMVVSSRPGLIDSVRSLRDHGFETTKSGRDIGTPGLNYRLSDLHAAVGLASLERSETEYMVRAGLASMYDDLLGSLEGVRVQGVPAGAHRVYQSYCIVLTGGVSRDRVMKDLRAQGIETAIGTYAVHCLSYYRAKYRMRTADYPVSSMLGERSIAIPMHSRMNEGDVTRVVKSLERALAK